MVYSDFYMVHFILGKMLHTYRVLEKLLVALCNQKYQVTPIHLNVKAILDTKEIFAYCLPIHSAFIVYKVVNIKFN